jgi:hypothetical protein
MMSTTANRYIQAQLLLAALNITIHTLNVSRVFSYTPA